MALPVRRSTVPAWNPFREIDELQRRLLDSTFGELPTRTSGEWTPPLDIEETDDAFVIEAEVPGVERDDVTVDLNDQELAVHGEVKEREREGVLRHNTRRTGTFDYRVRLPREVDGENVTAVLKDGVLRLELRKAVKSQPRRIEIDAA